MSEKKIKRALVWVQEFELTEEQWEVLYNWDDDARAMVLESLKEMVNQAEYIGSISGGKSHVRIERKPFIEEEEEEIEPLTDEDIAEWQGRY